MNMKKLFTLCLISLMALSASAQQMEFVDLGLPSGTFWKAVNEPGLYTYDEAMSKYNSQIPTNIQLEELRKECVWTWNGTGYHVTGPNGNFITLPASGHYNCNNGDLLYLGLGGYYWSSTATDYDAASYIFFDASKVSVYEVNRCNSFSVRLVR